MNGAERVIQKFGGVSALAHLLGKAPSTIQYWAKAGCIPARWQHPLLSLAQEHGIELSANDFISVARDGSQAPEGGPTVLPLEAEWRGVLTIGNLQVPISFRLSAVR